MSHGNWLALALLILLPTAARAEATLVVHGNGQALGPTPILARLDATMPLGAYALEPVDGGPPCAAFVYSEDGATVLGTVLPGVPADGARKYRLVRGPGKGDVVAIAEQRSGPNLPVTLNGKPFTTLVLDESSKPYLYPVIGPTGDPVTRAYPMENVEGEDHDHPHQRSFWFTHGNVNGFDFWSSDPLNRPNPRFGRIRPTHVHSEGAAQGSGLVIIRMTNDWTGPAGEKVCEDERVLRLYGNASPRFIDVDVTIKATEGPVTFADTKEGMFGLRVASSMDVKRKQGGKITNAEGITDTAAWGKASPWVDYTGPVAGKTVGVAILNHPSSFRYPTTWHVRDYGLFAANPFGYHDFGRSEKGDHTIPKGKSMRFQYRVILHEGDTQQAAIAAAFDAYRNPPRVELHAD